MPVCLTLPCQAKGSTLQSNESFQQYHLHNMVPPRFGVARLNTYAPLTASNHRVCTLEHDDPAMGREVDPVTQSR